VDTLIGTVPDDWRVQRLDECCDVQPGPSGSLLRSTNYVTGGIPVVKAGDVGLDGLNLGPVSSVNVETAERLVRYRLCVGDIVLVRIGVTTRHAMVAAPHNCGTSRSRTRTSRHRTGAAYHGTVGGVVAAQELLSVTLVPRPDGRSRRAGRWLVAAGYLVAAALAGLVGLGGGPGPDSVLYSADVVVRRRDTGAELLRTRITNSEEAERLVAYLREQLAELSVEQFGERWGISGEQPTIVES